MTGNDSYINQIQQQRQKRESQLMDSPLNWFSLVGLFPLRNGENTLGNGGACDINVPGIPDGAEALVAVSEDTISLLRVSSHFLVNGAPANPCQLRADIDGQPDLLEAASITIMVIRRGERHYLRVWDRDAQDFKDFRGLNYFPVDPAWRMAAEFFPFDPPREVTILDAIGGETRTLFPGYARFEINGEACTLMAEDAGDEMLFSFIDLTRLDATYPGGRYLLTGKPDEGRFVLDFNLAQNWPCAYTAYATCPLPPAENHLGIRVEAGEKRYHE